MATPMLQDVSLLNSFSMKKKRTHRLSWAEDSISFTNDFTKLEELSARHITASRTVRGDPARGTYTTSGRLIFLIKSGRRQTPRPDATRPNTVCTWPASCVIFGLNPAVWHMLIKAS